MSKTLRLICPQWQGGLNPNYVVGSELLACIAPASNVDESVTVSVTRDFDMSCNVLDGVSFGDVLLEQMKETKKILDTKRPDRVIIFGGDCSVTQVPFDYLSGKYGEQIGILWLDAHPDISTTETTTHLHEMPLSNLLGCNLDSELTRVQHPYAANRVFMAGLIEEDLRPMDEMCKKLRLNIGEPEELAKDSHLVFNWIKENGIRYLAVHWDLDVLSPVDFRSIYPAEPYTKTKDFPAAIGRMKLCEVGRLLNDVTELTEIVGLSITEHLPWDAFNLRKTLSGISIFNAGVSDIQQSKKDMG